MDVADKNRRDIQGLRALAVMLVIIYHVWPNIFSGGYIGVDVFFVVSGYLISSHLIQEIGNTGSLNLTGFWIRRIRRLLPAAVCVLLFCLALAFLFAPASKQQNIEEIAFSLAYIQNWLLLNNAVDYLAATQSDSLVQHYWSLSVEEQFYLIWPVLFLLLYQIQKSISWIVAGVLISFLISIAYSQYLVGFAPESAYFSTFSRGWEFCAGAAIYFIEMRISAASLSEAARRLLSIFGSTMIVVSAYTFDSNTDFPGFIALIPVVGTMLVIYARSDDIKYAFSHFTSSKPVQFFGDISYPLYLWHWPLVVFLQTQFGFTGFNFGLGFLIILSTTLLSFLTKKYIEDPIRFTINPIIVKRYVVPSLLIVPFLVLAAVVYQKSTLNSNRLDVTVGFPASKQALSQLINDTLSGDEWPATFLSPGKSSQVPEWVEDDCISVSFEREGTVDRCVYGKKGAEKRLVVLGDSWAVHFLPTIRGAFEEWEIQSLALGQCPLSRVSVHLWGDKRPFVECDRHRENVLAWIADNQPDLIILSDSPASTQQRLISGAINQNAVEEIVAGLDRYYSEIRAFDIPVIHLVSPPWANCDAGKVVSPRLCIPSSATQSEYDLSNAKKRVALKYGFRVVDTTFWACSEDLVCPTQVSSYLIKADGGHFSREYAQLISGILKDETKSLRLSIN